MKRFVRASGNVIYFCAGMAKDIFGALVSACTIRLADTVIAAAAAVVVVVVVVVAVVVVVVVVAVAVAAVAVEAVVVVTQ